MSDKDGTTKMSLKPCPFCGIEKYNEPHLPVIESDEHTGWPTYRVHCGFCGAESEWADSQEEAAGYWNRRKLQEETFNELIVWLKTHIAENEKAQEYLQSQGLPFKQLKSSQIAYLNVLDRVTDNTIRDEFLKSWLPSFSKVVLNFYNPLEEKP